MSSAMLASRSSPPPPPPPARDCVRRMASKSSRVSLSSLVIAAFACSPKTSGEANVGSVRRAAIYSSYVSHFGCAYCSAPTPDRWNSKPGRRASWL